MQRLLCLGLLLTACNGRAPEDPPAPVGPDLPTGTPSDAFMEGSRLFTVDSGTTVGSFEFCTGSGTLYVADTTLSGDFDCTWDDGEVCTVSFRDQPTDGPWEGQLDCFRDLGGPTTYDVLSSLPDAVASSSTELPMTGGSVFVNLDISTSP